MFDAKWFLPKNTRGDRDIIRENQLLKSQIQELLMLDETGFFIELDSLLRAILKKALILCKADSSFFALVRKTPPELDVRISNLIHEDTMNRIHEQFKIEYQKWLESESETMVVDDFILLPLMRRHRMLGVIGLKLNSEAPENVCEILPMLAKQASSSLESAILYERMLKRLLVLSNVFILGKEIISNVDLQALMEKFLAIARDGTQSEIACVYLVQEKEKEKGVFFWNIQTPKGQGNFLNDTKIVTPLIDEVIKTENFKIIEDLSQSSYYDSEKDKIEGFILRDTIVLPMKARERFVGVIQLANKIGKEPYSTEDTDLIKILSSQIAFVIQNTDLFKNLQKAYIDTLGALTSAIDAKDSYTLGHSERVTKLSVELGKEISLSNEELEAIRLASLMHDIGKIGIPENILNKPERLTDEEFEKIKSHPLLGTKILEKVEFLKNIIPVILHHHERYDGRGYPSQIAGEQIPMLSRIIAIADTFDAMTSDRPYRKALSVEEALAEIIRCKGSQFDPDLAEAFVKMVKRSHSIGSSL